MHINIYSIKYMKIKCLHLIIAKYIDIFTILSYKKPVYTLFPRIFLVSTSFIANIFRFKGSIYSL